MNPRRFAARRCRQRDNLCQPFMVLVDIDGIQQSGDAVKPP
jgi:hypothetical protein